MVDLVELKVDSSGGGERIFGGMIQFLIILIQNFLVNDILQPVDHSVFILLWIKLFNIVSLQIFNPSIDIVAIGHVDQSQKLIFVVTYVKASIHI